MNDKKITDEQIIKALEYCSKQDTCDEKCPFRYVNDGKQCYPTLLGNALDLINRQQKKIEKLEKIERLSIKIIEKQDVEIERLINIKADELEKAGNKCFDAGYRYGIIKFAERLKTKVNLDLCEAINCSDYLYDLPKLIDNLVKEMTEVSEE